MHVLLLWHHSSIGCVLVLGGEDGVAGCMGVNMYACM